MEWRLVREHYRRLLQASGRTQTDVTRAAGLSKSAISKLMANQGDGPTVATLLAAVQGLGMPLSEFFRRVEAEEDASRAGLSPAASSLDRPASLEQFERAVAVEFVRLRHEIDKIRRDTGGDAAGEPLAPLGTRRRRPRIPGDTASAGGTRNRRIA